MSGKVPPSSRANIDRTTKTEIARAKKLIESFTGHDPEVIATINVPPIPRNLVVIGECDAVLYTTVRDSRIEKYKHSFRAKDKPLLASSPDGKSLYLIGGNYQFTKLGIVDGTDFANLKRAGIDR